MATYLGSDAVNGPSTGSNIIAQAANLIQGFVSSPSAPSPTSTSSAATSSLVPSGLGYYVSMANNYADKINKVISGPDPSLPTYNISEEDKVIITS